MTWLMCGILKNDTNELIHKIEIDLQTQKTNLYGYQMGKQGWQGRDKPGVCDSNIPTTVYKTDRQQGLHRIGQDRYSMSYNNL